MSVKKILISTAEASGDQNAANLVKEMLKLEPRLELFGMGGAKLKDVGVEIVVNSESKSVVGLIETLPFLSFYYSALKTMKQLLDERKPDLVLLVDSQGFNMLLAAEAKKRGIRTAYYFAPQEWHWGTKKGLKKVAETLDLIIAVFEKEAQAYKAAGANVIYFGHPLLDSAAPKLSRQEFFREQNLDPSSTLIGLLPGNRKQELARLLPLLLESAKKISSFMGNSGTGRAQFLIPVFSRAYSKELEKAVADFQKTFGVAIKLVADRNYEVLAYASLVLCSPGTAALEATILGTPAIVTYQISPLSYWIAKHILRLNIEHFTMPNMIADRKIIPEFIQDKADPYQIAKVALEFLDGKRSFEYQLVKDRLGTPPVISQIARSLLS